MMPSTLDNRKIRPISSIMQRTTRESSSKTLRRDRSWTRTLKIRYTSLEATDSPYQYKSHSGLNTYGSYKVLQSILPVQFAWSCKASENRTHTIRPCIMLKPDFVKNLSLFGLCDSNNKQSASLMCSRFLQVLQSIKKLSAIPKLGLKTAYDQAIMELKLTGDFYEFSAVLMHFGKIFYVAKGDCAIIVGRKTSKGWNAERLKGNGIRGRKIEEGEKIVLICNGSLAKELGCDLMVNIASKYWGKNNPNIAGWEIIDLAKGAKSPICIVVFL